MKATHQNKLISSFMLWFDHTLLDKGEAFTNNSGYFYPTFNNYNGLYAYSAPFKQFVDDFSISNALIPTGVYLDNSFISVGQSGLSGINFKEGTCYFTGQITGANRISGRYAVKDFNVFLTERSESEILFETKYSLRPRISQTLSGVLPEEIPYPVIFIKPEATYNKEFAFGGQDITYNSIRAIVISDTQFKLDAVFSIFRDKQKTWVGFIESNEMPFNHLGYYITGSTYNYNNLIAGKGGTGSFFIDEVFSTSFQGAKNAKIIEQIQQNNQKVYMGIITFEVNDIRFPRI